MKQPLGILMAVILAGTTVLAASAPETMRADEENAAVWKPRVNSVAVFKNGMGFFIREGETRLRDGWCSAGEIPPAYFGTVAFFAQAKEELVDLVNSGRGETIEFDGVDAPADTAAKRARLEPLRLLSLNVSFQHQNAKRAVSGKLIAVDAGYAVLETDSTNAAVPLDEIKSIQVLDKPLRLHVAGAREQTKLGMAYLRNGITWLPEYTLKIIDQDTAELTLRGTLINDAEDLVHCDVNFVVGVPHFLHTQYGDPITSGAQMIRAAAATVAPAAVMTQVAMGNLLSNSIQSSRNKEDGAEPQKPTEAASALGNLPQMDNAGSSDFTVYSKKDLTVRRGEKAMVTLFTKKIKYAHIYRWQVPNTLEHFMTLENQTDTAWTTGACLALRDGNPLCEDLLRYTPKGAKAEIPVTTAVNITHDQRETEESRELKKYEPSRGFWLDRVVLKGDLEVRNMEKTPVSVVVTLPVPGNPVEGSDGGETTVDTSKLQLMERSGSIRWALKVAPGETKTVHYRYERYVPSR